MPERSPKRYGCIFGFHRRVWWPKCTPASRSSRRVTTGTAFLLPVLFLRSVHPGPGLSDPGSGPQTCVLGVSGRRPKESSSLPAPPRLRRNHILNRLPAVYECAEEDHVEERAGEDERPRRDPGIVGDLARAGRQLQAHGGRRDECQEEQPADHAQERRGLTDR